MKNKVLSILLLLCLVFTLLPSEALAVTYYSLYVGNMHVYNSDIEDTTPRTAGVTYYWKASESGDDAYTETGSADDYLFSVLFDEDSESFTLMLNGAEITSFSSLGDYDYGIFSNAPLNIVLASGTENTVDIFGSTDSESNGVYVSGALTIDGNGSISASGGTYGIVSWGSEASLGITGGRISASGTAYGILVDGNVTVSGGKVSATASGESGDGIAATGNLSIPSGSVIAYGNRHALGVNGSTTVSIASYKYRTNTTVTAPATNYTLHPGSDFANSNDYKYVEILTIYEVTKVTAEKGSFAVSVGGSEAESAAAGDIVRLTAVPNSGYVFSSWSVYKTGEMATTVSVSENSFIMPTYPVTVKPSFTSAGSSGGRSSVRTITVTETSSGLFSGTQGSVKAEANMTRAFSSSVEVKVIDTDDNASGFGLGIGNTVYPFDISLYIRGTNTKTEPEDGYAVTISLPIPDELLDVKEQLSVAHKADEESVTMLASQLKQINGVWYLVFKATEFSPYAMVVKNIGTYDETVGLPYYLGSHGTEIFIGFVANGKYIAPSGAAVLFKENAKSFTDTGSHWAKDYVGFVTEREIFLGTGQGAFSPDIGMTRAMFATVMGRLYERSFGKIETMSTHAFIDCDYDDYYGKYVDWAAKEGVIGGYGNGKFGPDDPITREQMAAILYRFADFLSVLPSNMKTVMNYHDTGSISNWAGSAALYCQSTGIIKGRGGGSFVPKGTATRAEVAVILERFIENTLN